MSFLKGSGNKYSKRATDVGTPQIVRPSFGSGNGIWMGAADIDTNNAETFYFHIFGGVPNIATLFVYGQLFNQAFYTELGLHDHGPGTLETATANPDHQHDGQVVMGSHNHTGSTGSDTHHHAVWVGNDDSGFKIDIDDDAANNAYHSNFPVDGTSRQILQDDAHSHTVTINSTNLGSKSFTTNAINGTVVHSHLVDTGETDEEGLAPNTGSMHLTGTAKAYFSALKIEIDGVDRTAALLTQASLAAFGDGTSGHTIVTTGVELDISTWITSPGQHKIKFSLNTGAPNNGGKVRYNLYTQ